MFAIDFHIQMQLDINSWSPSDWIIMFWGDALSPIQCHASS